jgi:hypothetical protein
MWCANCQGREDVRYHYWIVHFTRLSLRDLHAVGIYKRYLGLSSWTECVYTCVQWEFDHMHTRQIPKICRSSFRPRHNMSKANPPADAIRPSASLVIVNSRNEILLVHRNPKLTAFGGLHVRKPYCNRSHSAQLFDDIRVYIYCLARCSQVETLTRDRTRR